MLREYEIDKIYEMNYLDKLFHSLSPSELLFRIDDIFSIRHDYFIVDGVGDLKSFRTHQEAENHLKTTKEDYKNHLNSIIDRLLDEEEPGVIIDYDSCRILEAGDRDALMYSLKNYKNQKVTIVKLPNDRIFIKGLVERPNLLIDFHQLTTDMFD